MDAAGRIGRLSQRHLHKAAHFFRRLLLHFCRDVGIGIQCKTGGKMPQHLGQRFDIHSVLQRNCRKCMPAILLRVWMSGTNSN